MTKFQQAGVLSMSSPSSSQRAPGRYRGSALLASCWARMARVALAVALLWALTGWALGWW